jgi:hypothetical protein
MPTAALSALPGDQNPHSPESSPVMPCMTRHLERSVAARWRERTAGVEEDRGTWRTRIGYYRAVLQALSRDGEGRLAVHDIVEGHASGKPSTFYALAANGALVHAYRHHQDPGPRAVGELVGREPVAHVVAETKVWSFWQQRSSWLRDVDEWYPAAEFPATSRLLVGRLVEWRDAHPLLAAAQNGMPPLCAVEDLVVLSRNLLTARQAAQRLAQALTAPDGRSATLDLGIPARLPRRRRPSGDSTVMAGRLHAAIELITSSGPASDERASAVHILRAVARELAELPRSGC